MFGKKKNNNKDVAGHPFRTNCPPEKISFAEEMKEIVRAKTKHKVEVLSAEAYVVIKTIIKELAEAEDRYVLWSTITEHTRMNELNYSIQEISRLLIKDGFKLVIDQGRLKSIQWA